MTAKCSRVRLARIDRELDALITPERILASAAWQEVHHAIVAALQPYPDARQAVFDHLAALRAARAPRSRRA